MTCATMPIFVVKIIITVSAYMGLNGVVGFQNVGLQGPRLLGNGIGGVTVLYKHAPAPLVLPYQISSL